MAVSRVNDKRVSFSGRIEREDGSWINRADYLYNTTDAFGIQISESTRNVADIGSHYVSSPERHRLFLNGSRVFLQYGTNAKFEDAVDTYILKPAGGDVMVYRTTERFRYVVGYVIVPSFAFQVNQSLQGDDKVVIGYGEPDLENDMANANGWFWEFTAGSDTSCRLSTYRDGTEVAFKVVDLSKAITIWKRYEDRINWYNAGNRISRETYTVDGQQFNDIVGLTSVDTGKGPTRANFPLTYAVKADAGTTGLELDTGSVGVKILGDIDPIFRVKEAVQSGSHSGGGDWEVLFAVREDPDNDNVYMNLSDVKIAEVSSDADVEVLAISVDPSKTDASGFTTPVYHTGTNSALLETTSVTTFPNALGTVGTSATDPGGYQVGFTSYFTAGTGQSARRTTAGRGTRKRPFNDNDIIIFLAKTSTAMTIIIEYETEQQW